jgi:hypothetical protein
VSTPERLAYWYFRLNGFLTTENFIIHPDTGSDQRTDADLIAVRFLHRAENLVQPMEDDPRVASCRTLANVIIAEVKTGPCALNGPWTRPETGNMWRALRAIGCVPEDAIDLACDLLLRKGYWSDATVTIRLFGLGESMNPDLPIPATQQLTWGEVIAFCIQRFKAYELQKAAVPQWTCDGIRLKQCALNRRNQKEPDSAIRAYFNLHQRPTPSQQESTP